MDTDARLENAETVETAEVEINDVSVMMNVGKVVLIHIRSV